MKSGPEKQWIIQWQRFGEKEIGLILQNNFNNKKFLI